MRRVVITLLSVLAFFANIVLSPILAIYWAKIDFVMINIVCLAFFSKKWYPPVLAALYSGLLIDLTTQAGTFINTGMYSFLAVAAVAGAAIISDNNFIVISASVLLAECIKHFLLVFVLYIMRLSQSATLLTFVHGLPSAIYSTLIAAGMYFVYKFIFSLYFMQEKSENNNRHTTLI